MSKPILCLDFDGVIHSYKSGWEGAHIISDPPVPGAIAFLIEATKHFRVSIYSSRSGLDGGIEAMQAWLRDWLYKHLRESHGDIDADGQNTSRLVIAELGGEVMDNIGFPTMKPSAFITLDDRAIQFQGTFPDPEELLNFQPWWKNA